MSSAPAARCRRRCFALARERPLDEVTIADIVERAGVNRSSFYQHYSDKETLLADALDATAEAAGAALPELVEPPREPPQALFAFLEHFEANADLYRRVLVSPGSAVVQARLRARIEAIVGEGVVKSGNPRVRGPAARRRRRGHRRFGARGHSRRGSPETRARQRRRRPNGCGACCSGRAALGSDRPSVVRV